MSECNHYYKKTRSGSYHCDKCDDFHQPDELIQILSTEIGSNRCKIKSLATEVEELKQGRINAITPLSKLLSLAVCVEMVEGSESFSDKIRDCTVEIRKALTKQTKAG